MNSDVRRSALFVIDIGVPFLAATALGLHRAAVLGALAGLLCSFADEYNKGLAERLRTLAFAVGGVFCGGLLGFWLSDYPPVFWIMFVLAVFAAGWLNVLGKGPHMGMRFGAIALGVISGTAQVTHDLLWVPLGAVAVSPVVRIGDHLLNGPVPMPAGFKPPAKPQRHRDWIRFALAYAAAAAVGMWIGVHWGATRAIWVTTAPLVAMQSEALASYRRAVEFVVGTALGVAATFVITSVVGAHAVLSLIVLTLSAAIPLQFPRRFWLQTAMIATLMLTVYSLAIDDINQVRPIIFERLEDILVGCVLAAVGTFLAFSEQVAAIGFDEAARGGAAAGSIEKREA
jgi:F0F1-type ATP synthase assembly protein I